MAKQKLFTKSIDDMLFAQYKFNSNFEKQKVACKIFNPYGDGTWYILNSDPDDPDYLWAIVQMFGNVEVGSVSRSELESISFFGMNLGLERDISFEPISALEVYEGLLAGKHYAKGGRLVKKNIKIKDWYLKNYPTDDLGEELDGGNTFEDMWSAIHEGTDIYDFLGVGDSVIRERVFEELALLYGVKYDYVYDKAFDNSSGYAKGGEITPKVNAEIVKRAEVIYADNNGSTKEDFDVAYAQAITEAGYNVKEYISIMDKIGIEHDVDTEDFYAKGGKMSEVQWANDENKKLGIWLLTSVDGNKILRMSKNAKELEKNVMNYYNKKGSVARMIYDENASEGLSWVVFEELFQEIQSVYAKGGETGDFDWEALSYNQKLSLVRESGLMDSVALKSVGTITPVEMSKLKNSVRLNRELQTGKFEYGGELTLFDDFMRAFREDYDDMDNYLAAFASLEEAKQFAINNKNKYGVIVFLDAYGDSIWVDKNDTKEDIDFLFSTEYAKGGEINKDNMIDEPYRVVVSDKVADKLELYLDKYNINYEFVHNTNVGGLNVSVYDIMPNSEISHRYFDAILSRFMYGFEGIYPSISDYTYEDEYAKGGGVDYKNVTINITKYYDRKEDKWKDISLDMTLPYKIFSDEYSFPSAVTSNLERNGYKVLGSEWRFKVVDSEKYAKGGRITTNDEIIEAFLRSERTARINNLYIYPKDNEMVLVNYRTIIARRMGNKVYVTTRKYSVTTSKIQSKIRSTAMRLGLDLIEVDDITTLSPPKLPEPRKRGERKAATPKPQSSFFSEFAKGGKIKKSKDKQYMKDVDVYKYFIVNLQTQKVESGWEHKSDAIEALSNYDGDANYKVVSERGLKLHGISNPKKEWKKFADGGRVYGAGIFKEGGINDGHNVDLEATKKLILNMPKEDILTFVQNVSSDVKTQDQAIAWVNSMTQDIANNIWIKLYLVYKYNPNYGFYEDGGELNFNEDVNGGVVVYTGDSRIDRKGLESIFSKFPMTYKRIDVIRVPNLSKEEVEIIAAFLQQSGGFYGGIEEQPIRVSDDEVKESVYTINLSATIGKNYTPQEVLNATMAVLSMFSNEIGKVSFYIIKYLSAFHANNLQNALKPYNLFIDTRIQLPQNWYKFEKGGKIGFKALSKKVAERYAGKKVPSKYQSEYGKSYSKEEAREVGNKVAAKVYRQQLVKRK